MKLNLLTPLNDLGYGVAGVNILRGLSGSHEVSLFPIGHASFNPPEATANVIKTALKNALDYDDEAPSVRIWHQNALAEHVGRGPRVGFPFFELSPLTDVEVFHCNRMDVLLVASEWAKGVAEQSGVVKPVHVVPLGVDREVFRPRPTERHKTARGGTTIFFNVGKWEIRKGHDLLLSAFNKAFTPADDVLLRMCCHNPFIGPGNVEWARHYQTSRMGAAGKIEILDARLNSQQDVADFMNEGDVGVFPARAEGWNLDLLEAMSMAKPVIATNFSAHTEFVDGDNARLIEIDWTEPAVDGVWFHGQGRWAMLGESQEEQLIEHMRDLHRRHDPNENGVATAERFSWNASADALVEAISV